MTKNKNVVKIRKYDKSDHDVVCRIFYNGIMENWLQSYKRKINLKAPVCSLAQLVQFYAVFQYLQSFLLFLDLVLVQQMITIQTALVPMTQLTTAITMTLVAVP